MNSKEINWKHSSSPVQNQSNMDINDIFVGMDYLITRILFYTFVIRNLQTANGQYCTFNSDCALSNYCWNRQCSSSSGTNPQGGVNSLLGYTNNPYYPNYGSYSGSSLYGGLSSGGAGSLYGGLPAGGAGYGFNNYGYGYSFGRRMAGDRCVVSSDCQSNLCWQGVCIQSGGGTGMVTGYGLEGTDCITDVQCIYGSCINRVCRSYTSPQYTTGTFGLYPDGYPCTTNTQCSAGICFYGYCGSSRYGSLVNNFGGNQGWGMNSNRCGYVYSCTPSLNTPSERLVISSSIDNNLRRSGSICALDAECYSGTCYSGICSNDSPAPGKVGTNGQCGADIRCYSNVCSNGQCN